ncbi:NAD-dependent epimerase/dehydratase family protein [Thalassolituus sp. LLYu03]|uniref:NAD-dependent epimerase/dehydratase family protein n=1 Tax=Thalassolituus sp. LLYu03 TaxID=3421656 RepID=UPI003D28629C
MQTILGASGQIGRELAISLKREFTSDIRLVSRNPEKVNDTDTLLSADLLDAAQTLRATEGSDIVYFTAGLPMDTSQWVAQFPIMMRNVIDACAAHNAKLVYFDNTYMYPQNSTPLTEDSPFSPNGTKGKVRAEMVLQLLDAMHSGRVQAMICRAPEFYGPGQTQSITNSAVIDALAAGKTARVFLRDDTLRTLIYTPDASRAMAWLGNTADAYNQTWHLPCDDQRVTYRQFVSIAADVFRTAPDYKVLKPWQLSLATLFSKQAREVAELLPRYNADNLFVSDKFKARFPDFAVTRIRDGLAAIARERQPSS